MRLQSQGLASWLRLSASSPDLPTHISDGVPTRLSDTVPSLSRARSRVGGGRWGTGALGPAGLRLSPAGSPVPQPAASRNLSGSQLSCPSPRRSRAESAELKSGHGKRKSYITGRSQEGRVETGRDSPKGAEGGAKSTRASGEETLGMGRILVHVKEEEFTRRRRVMVWEESPGPSGASPQRPPPPPTAARAERVKPREGALILVPFLLGRQPKPEPGKAAAEHMGPETTAPPSPPGRVGRQLGVGGEQVAGPSHTRLSINCSRP